MVLIARKKEKMDLIIYKTSYIRLWRVQRLKKIPSIVAAWFDWRL